MIRVHVICEGQTEEMFVNELLAPHFLSRRIILQPALLGKPGHKGGNVKFERILTDVRLRLLGDKQSHCTTLIDFYGICPEFPGYQEASQLNQHRAKAKCILTAMQSKIEGAVGDKVTRRFIPYVQMYEFEGLLFSEPATFADAICQPRLAESLDRIRKDFASPEEINDSRRSAPSKRIKGLFAGFQKPIHGTFAAVEIGLETIRRECPLFSDWLSRIEALASDEETL